MTHDDDDSMRGQCITCHAPTENERACAMCATCLRGLRVRGVYREDSRAHRQHQRGPGCEPGCPGWAIFNVCGDGSANIERCDMCDTVEDDHAAASIATRGVYHRDDPTPSATPSRLVEIVDQATRRVWQEMERDDDARAERARFVNGLRAEAGLPALDFGAVVAILRCAR